MRVHAPTSSVHAVGHIAPRHSVYTLHGPVGKRPGHVLAAALRTSLQRRGEILRIRRLGRHRRVASIRRVRVALGPRQGHVVVLVLLLVGVALHHTQSTHEVGAQNVPNILLVLRRCDGLLRDGLRPAADTAQLDHRFGVETSLVGDRALRGFILFRGRGGFYEGVADDEFGRSPLHGTAAGRTGPASQAPQRSAGGALATPGGAGAGRPAPC
mmetsp:Transcript_102746/g.329445  ORF Transcript_102746/g.329445 Transcript_102746/m.329445 type:complete len:213 (-) Transcript_102746:9-647(-)